MRNRFCALLLFFLAFNINASWAQRQVTIDAYGYYVPVVSYEGVTIHNAYRTRVDLNWISLNYPNWSLMVKVKGTIRNLLGKTIDPNRIKIRINSISGDGPSIQEMGASQEPVPLSFSNVALIRKSKTPLTTAFFQFYKSFTISFDIIVEGGAYLEDLKSLFGYDLNLEFSLLNANDQVLHSDQADPVRIDLFILGAPPSGPTYSLQVNGNASAGVLEFHSPQDFATGIARTYSSGLSVISSTPYQLQVRTLTSDFVANNNSVPVNTVGLQLKTVGAVKQGTITLSNINQTVINNETSTGSQARLYDIRYFTQPNDTRLLKAVPANYQATVMYTLMPQ